MHRFILLALLISTSAAASFFEDGNRYFNDQPRNEQSKPTDKSPTQFDWKKHLDTERDEFFREGEHLPPAPFLEAIRRPTKENILLFEKWQSTRNMLLARYESARAKYLRGGKGTTVQEIAPAPPRTEHLAKFRYSFYFDAKCPACNAMFSTVNEMAARGLQVEAYRLDGEKAAVIGLSIPWTEAKPSEIKSGLFKTVPVLIAFDEKNKVAFKMVGRMTLEQIATRVGR